MSTTVGQTPLKQKAWTVILFMAAADEQLERFAIRDIEELQKVGTTDELNVVVQIHRRWAGYGERYCVNKERSDFLGAVRGKDETPIGTGTPEVLSEFVDWTRRNFEARHYLLVL